jgi:hypothetical protein
VGVRRVGVLFLCLEAVCYGAGLVRRAFHLAEDRRVEDHRVLEVVGCLEWLAGSCSTAEYRIYLSQDSGLSIQEAVGDPYFHVVVTSTSDS